MKYSETEITTLDYQKDSLHHQRFPNSLETENSSLSQGLWEIEITPFQSPVKPEPLSKKTTGRLFQDNNERDVFFEIYPPFQSERGRKGEETMKFFNQDGELETVKPFDVKGKEFSFSTSFLLGRYPF